MSTAVRPRRRTRPGEAGTNGARPADVLVVFGITGDLAKAMTFRSLYRLERRGLLGCPIVGVAAALNEEVHRYLDESQVCRIDHFLGKMGLVEILCLRFANTMFEPVWNRNYVAAGELATVERVAPPAQAVR